MSSIFDDYLQVDSPLHNHDNNDDITSVNSEDLFSPEDKIILEGTIYKFKPGISTNFIQRYVQISERAFRYFKDESYSVVNKPLVAFRKSIICKVVKYDCNKGTYMKGRNKNNELEKTLFDHMFEV